MASSCQEWAGQVLKLRFFDLDAAIYSDSEAHLELLARLYRCFQVNGVSAPPQPPVEFAVLTRPDNAWGRPVMILDGEVQPLPDPHLLAAYVYQAILCAILARVRSHILIHAGAVARGRQGVILAADSFHGKTTLVLELVRRGFKFLSDETAALGRADRRLHPFPRSLSLRPGTLELTGFPKIAVETPAWSDKLFLDVEQIQPGSMGQAAPVSHVIVLQDPAEVEQERPDSPDRELGILVDRLDETFLAAVRQIEGVTGVCPDSKCGYPLLRLRTARRTFVFSQIKVLCRAWQILILDVITESAGQPSFASPARLEAIPRSQAVVELLRRFQGGYQSAILDEGDGSSTRLFMELAAIVGQAQCHRLFVGPLPEVADLVCGLIREA